MVFWYCYNCGKADACCTIAALQHYRWVCLSRYMANMLEAIMFFQSQVPQGWHVRLGPESGLLVMAVHGIRSLGQTLTHPFCLSSFFYKKSESFYILPLSHCWLSALVKALLMPTHVRYSPGMSYVILGHT